MPWPMPADRCHWHGTSAAREGLAGDEQRVERDHVVLVAMDRAGSAASRGPRPSGCRRPCPPRARACPNSRRSPRRASRRRRPTCSAIMVPWLKPTRASFEAGRLWRASSGSSKASSPGPAWFTPRQRSCGSRKVRANHCRPIGAPGHELGRMRRDEGRVGQPALPLPADLDQVVAVGAVAVEEHDKLLCRAGSGRKARAVEGCRHGRHPARRGECGQRIALSERWPGQASLRRGGATPARPRAPWRRGNRPTAPSPRRRAMAPALGQRDELLHARPRLKAVGDTRRLLQGEIAGREGVGMAEAEQQIDVGRPGPDALDRR